MDIFDGRTYNAITLVLALIAAVLTLIGTWYTHRSTVPRRRNLEIRHDRAYPLTTPSVANAGVSVTAGTVVVPDPFVLTFQLRNTGQLDVEPSDFQGVITLDLQATVKDIIGLRCEAGGVPPNLGISSTTIRVKPSLIQRNECVEFRVLTEGKPVVDLSRIVNETSVALIVRPNGEPARSPWPMTALRIVVAASVIAGFSFSFLSFREQELQVDRAQAARRAAESRPTNSQPSLVLSVDRAIPGSTVVLTGVNWPPGHQVYIGMMTKQGLPTGPSTGLSPLDTANEDGVVTYEFSAPALFAEPPQPKPDGPHIPAEFLKPNTVLIHARDVETAVMAWTELEIEI